MLNTEYRLYDPRLAQWLTRDPVFQPWESPYSAMAGNPILFSDPQGLNNKKGGLQPGFQGPPERPGTINNSVEVPEVVVEAERPKNNGNTQTTNTKANTEVQSNKSRTNQLPTTRHYTPNTNVRPGLFGWFISYMEYVIQTLPEYTYTPSPQEIEEKRKVNPFIPPSNGLDIPTTTTGTDTPPGFEPVPGHKPDRQPVIAPPPYGIVDDDDDRNEITLYRGVYFGHPDYHNALKGEAHPMNLNSTTTAEQHNLGDNNSMFTSWTRRRSVAVGFANQVRRPGVVLVKKFKIGEIVPSPDVFEEEEVLVPGIVRGAIVTPP